MIFSKYNQVHVFQLILFLMTFFFFFTIKVNNCPMCRTEFPTDDPDYENFKKHKVKKKSISLFISLVRASLQIKNYV